MYTERKNSSFAKKKKALDESIMREKPKKMFVE